jgi:PKD repeat protein
VQFSDVSEGTATSWSWSFGDGGTSNLRNPSHVYSPGTYTVSLTVNGQGGPNTRTRAGFIVAQDLAPVAEFALAPSVSLAPLAVQFSDLSTGAINSRLWSFGDGSTASSANPLHAYAAPGTYSVSLTAAGAYGTSTRTKTGCVVVQSPVPVADFDAAPTSGVAPFAAQFTDLSTGNIASWLWSFGDGTTASLAQPQHVYETPGTYTVSLTVSGPNGSASKTRNGLIVVSEPPPHADFLCPSTTGFAPFSPQFTDQSSGNVTTRTWTFGDGATGGSANPQHTYLAPGTYTVSLTVHGPTGTGSVTKLDLVRVEDPTPVASFTAPQSSGVAPLAVQFSNTSTGNMPPGGDGSSATAPSAERDPGTSGPGASACG